MNSYSDIRFGISQDFDMTFGTSKPTCIYHINDFQFLSFTHHKVFRFDRHKIIEVYPFKLSTSVYIPELEIVVGITANTSNFIAFSVFGKETSKLLLSDVDSKHVGVFHMLYSQKSHSIVTIGSGIKVWALKSDRWNANHSAMPPVINIELKSSFADDFQTSIINPPCFDPVSELIYLPTLQGIQPFTLSGNALKSVAFIASSLSTDRSSSIEAQKQILRSVVYCMWFEESCLSTIEDENSRKISFVTWDPVDGLALWSKTGHLKKRITITNSSLIMVSFIDSETLIYLDTNETLYILNLKTEKAFPCWNLPHKPSRVFLFKHRKLSICLCLGITAKFLNIHNIWSVWALGVPSARKIERCSKKNEAARIVVFTNSAFVKVLTSKKARHISSPNPPAGKVIVDFFYDRGIVLYRKKSEKDNNYALDYTSFDTQISRDHLFLITEDGYVSCYDTASETNDIVILESIGSRHIVPCLYNNKWVFASISLSSDISLFSYSSFKLIKKFFIKNEAIINAYYDQSSGCMVIIFNTEIVLFNHNRGYTVSRETIKTPLITAFQDSVLYMGFSTGHIARAAICDDHISLHDYVKNEKPHKLAVTSFSFSLEYWISSSLDGHIQFWDYEGMSLFLIALPVPIHCCCVKNSKQDLLVATDNEIMIIKGSVFAKGIIEAEIKDLDTTDQLIDKTIISRNPFLLEEEEETENVLKEKTSVVEAKKVSLPFSFNKFLNYDDIHEKKVQCKAGEVQNVDSKKIIDDIEKKRILAEMTQMTLEATPFTSNNKNIIKENQTSFPLDKHETSEGAEKENDHFDQNTINSQNGDEKEHKPFINEISKKVDHKKKKKRRSVSENPTKEKPLNNEEIKKESVDIIELMKKFNDRLSSITPQQDTIKSISTIEKSIVIPNEPKPPKSEEKLDMEQTVRRRMKRSLTTKSIPKEFCSESINSDRKEIIKEPSILSDPTVIITKASETKSELPKKIIHRVLPNHQSLNSSQFSSKAKQISKPPLKSSVSTNALMNSNQSDVFNVNKQLISLNDETSFITKTSIEVRQKPPLPSSHTKQGGIPKFLNRNTFKNNWNENNRTECKMDSQNTNIVNMNQVATNPKLIQNISNDIENDISEYSSETKEANLESLNPNISRTIEPPIKISDNANPRSLKRKAFSWNSIEYQPNTQTNVDQHSILVPHKTDLFEQYSDSSDDSNPSINDVAQLISENYSDSDKSSSSSPVKHYNFHSPLARMMRLNNNPIYTKNRTPTPPPLRRNRLTKRFNYTRASTPSLFKSTKVYNAPPPNVIIDYEAVYNEYRRGKVEFEPLLIPILGKNREKWMSSDIDSGIIGLSIHPRNAIPNILKEQEFLNRVSTPSTPRRPNQEQSILVRQAEYSESNNTEDSNVHSGYKLIRTMSEKTVRYPHLKVVHESVNDYQPSNFGKRYNKGTTFLSVIRSSSFSKYRNKQSTNTDCLNSALYVRPVPIVKPK